VGSAAASAGVLAGVPTGAGAAGMGEYQHVRNAPSPEYIVPSPLPVSRTPSPQAPRNPYATPPPPLALARSHPYHDDDPDDADDAADDEDDGHATTSTESMYSDLDPFTFPASPSSLQINSSTGVVDQRMNPAAVLGKRGGDSNGRSGGSSEEAAAAGLTRPSPHTAPSAVSLSDGEDYSRRVLAVTNNVD